MRPSLHPAAPLFVVIFCFASFAHTQSTTSEPRLESGNLTLYVTGRLFGYYRIAQPALEPVNAFLSDEKPGLLLGMGDNFGPEFGARLQESGSAGNPCYVPPGSGPLPESIYKNDSRLVPTADCDTVANFLIRAGYSALVPGREDFLYGAGWLRNIGLRLASNPANTPAPRMLAANLRLLPEKPPTLPNPFLVPCSIFFDPDLRADDLPPGN